MNRSLRHPVVVLALLVSTSPASAQSATAPAGPTALRHGDTIVFVVDETIDTADPRRNIAFPLLVETFLTVRYPELRLEYHYAGWAGDTVGRALLRLDRDVLSRNPTVIVICLGLNDPRYATAAEQTKLLPAFKEQLAALVERCRQTGARVWLVSPPAVREQLGQTVRVTVEGKSSYVDLSAIAYNQTLQEYTNAMRELAQTAEVGFVDWLAAMAAEQINPAPTREDELYSPNDPRIPLARGQAAAAMKLLQAWGAQPSRTEINLDWTAGTASVDVPTGGTGQPAISVTVTEQGQRILEMKNLPIPGGRPAALKSHWSAAAMCQFLFRITDPPPLGIRLNQQMADGTSRGDLAISASQLRAGLNLALAAPMQATTEAQDLLRLITLKHSYRYNTWRRLELSPPEETELVEAQRQLATAWQAYATAYERIIARRPKTFFARLILAEDVPEERLPTAQPTRPRPAEEESNATAPAGTAPAQ